MTAEWKRKTSKPRKFPVESPQEVIKKAMEEHSKPSGLPKDWRNRVFKNT